ncbi:MAG: ribosome silencing factor [Methylomonas sp.]|nr:ribosome silencing factor [Methylomonas sp.]PPD22370.1 MAG: ribosome silencing factor [Methylomonas sp.]PPD26874.1 MAG: ribosome silencing factor [Methylomonas sp.]PPD37671.1 MAG: ribosome silencing factor [Methylomonas sp.]PPD38782.1 MAG: ribosome silencing factor [Methylomonas sp.]
MQAEQLLNLVETVLNDHKAQRVTVLDVRGKTSVTDYMVIATATSSRHASALSGHLAGKIKENGLLPLGVEGATGSDWVLIDLGDVVVHLMTVQSREFYQLEKLWSVSGEKQMGA